LEFGGAGRSVKDPVSRRGPDTAMWSPIPVPWS
jgi:hypothetical protein